jgi:dTDP-4-dehydrorhamnose 3,5-epimerase-like enzyme
MLGLEFINIPSIAGAYDGEVLRVYEYAAYSISVERVFTVTACRGAKRGRHAHKKCTQILSCVSGEIDLFVDDGVSQEILRLTTNSDAVLIPPGIWAEQRYLKDCSVLIVHCDQPYDEDDYLRDYEEFIDWRNKTK